MSKELTLGLRPKRAFQERDQQIQISLVRMVRMCLDLLEKIGNRNIEIEIEIGKDHKMEEYCDLSLSLSSFTSETMILILHFIKL